MALASAIGTDGHTLLTAVYAPTAPAWLRDVPAVCTLRAVGVQQYDAPNATGTARWRAEADWPPSAVRISSPHDPDARYSTTRDTHGVDYKAHLTETCDTDMPSLITDVQTTRGTTACQDQNVRFCPSSRRCLTTFFTRPIYQQYHDCERRPDLKRSWQRTDLERSAWARHARLSSVGWLPR